ncbi:MAG: Sir2 silent information regulator family NAD-dependent deacetylase, partial [Oribacterium sp.]|nr:Sir2 silent information regulator family NAD-dependent deacetylase [Oribacterium sp.]
MFGRMRITSETTENGMEKFRKVLDEADTVIIGAGSGLSTAAGYTYSGERFNTYFSDFKIR